MNNKTEDIHCTFSDTRILNFACIHFTKVSVHATCLYDLIVMPSSLN